MQTKTKFALVAIPFAAVGFLLDATSPLGPAIWGPIPEGPSPTGGTLAALMLVLVLQDVGFGVGVAFIAFGWPRLRRAGTSLPLATAAYVAIAWGLVSWVPHTAMHFTNASGDFARLALIEYLFHATLLVGAAVAAAFFWKALDARVPATRTIHARPRAATPPPAR